MKTILDFLLRPIKSALGSFKRFPVATVYIVLLFMIFSFLVQFENISETLSTTLVLSAAFGILLNLVLVGAYERSQRVLRHWQFIMLGGIIAPLFLFLVLNLLPLDEMMKARVIALLFSLFIAFLIIPTIKSEKFDFNNNCLITLKAVFIAIVYGLVLMLGLLFLAFSVKSLLFKELSEKVFTHISIFSALVGTVFFVGYFPHFNDETDDERFVITTKVTLFIEVLISYIIIPVLTAFTLVFLGYATKIMILWNWPSNEFALYSALYCLAGLFIYIISSNIQNSFSKFFRIWFPKLLILVLGLQAISIYLRVAAYGLTERRYFLILFWIFCVFCSVWFHIKNIKKNKTVAVFAISLIVLSVLPIVNYSEFSAFTQVVRAESILKKNEMLQNGSLKINATINKEDQKQLTSILTFLSRTNRFYIAPWLPKDFTPAKAKEYLGFSIVDVNEPQTSSFYSYVLSDNSFYIDGYDILVNTTRDYYEGGSLDKATFIGKKGTYSFELKNNNTTGALSLSLKLNNKEILHSTLESYITKLKNENKDSLSTNADYKTKGNEMKLSFDKMSTVLEADGTKLLIVFKNLSNNQVPNRDGTLVDTLEYNFQLFIKE